MILDQTTWRELEQKTRKLGELTKQSRQPAPDGNALWAQCRRLCRPVLSAEIDPGLLQRLHHAFHEGYQPHLISLTATASSLRRRGLFADLARHETRVALYTGRWPHTGRTGDPWPVSVGPGWMSGSEAFATTDTAVITEHRTAASPRPVPPGQTPDALAADIIAAIDHNPDSCGGSVMPTAIAEVPFADSQVVGGPGLLSLIHDGEHGAPTFQQQLAALVDGRLHAREHKRGVEMTVFAGRRDDLLTRTHGLLTHHRAGLLVFSGGHQVPADTVVSIRVHLLPGTCPPMAVAVRHRPAGCDRLASAG
jgi:hypothetical protein